MKWDCIDRKVYQGDRLVCECSSKLEAVLITVAVNKLDGELRLNGAYDAIDRLEVLFDKKQEDAQILADLANFMGISKEEVLHRFRRNVEEMHGKGKGRH